MHIELTRLFQLRRVLNPEHVFRGTVLPILQVLQCPLNSSQSIRHNFKRMPRKPSILQSLTKILTKRKSQIGIPRCVLLQSMRRSDSCGRVLHTGGKQALIKGQNPGITALLRVQDFGQYLSCGRQCDGIKGVLDFGLTGALLDSLGEFCDHVLGTGSVVDNKIALGAINQTLHVGCPGSCNYEKRVYIGASSKFDGKCAHGSGTAIDDCWCWFFCYGKGSWEA